MRKGYVKGRGKVQRARDWERQHLAGFASACNAARVTRGGDYLYFSVLARHYVCIAALANGQQDAGASSLNQTAQSLPPVMAVILFAQDFQDRAPSRRGVSKPSTASVSPRIN